MDELASPAAFDIWFQREITPVVDPAWAEVEQAIQRCLLSLDARVEQEEGLHRDRWQVFATHPIKASARVLAKVLAGREQPSTHAELRRCVLDQGDLARLRVVASLKRDVQRCLAELLPAPNGRLLGRFPVRNRKDFVRDEAQRRPLAGHRAIQLVIQVPDEAAAGEPVHVELQIMTALQHVWDRRNHCVYEWLRSGGADRSDAALELRVDDHAIAETLHVADALADHNFSKFLELRRESP